MSERPYDVGWMRGFRSGVIFAALLIAAGYAIARLL